MKKTDSERWKSLSFFLKLTSQIIWPCCVSVLDLISPVVCTGKIKHYVKINVVEGTGGLLRTKEWISSCLHVSLPFQSKQGFYSGLPVSSLLLFLFGSHGDWLRVSSLDPSLSFSTRSVTLSELLCYLSVPQLPSFYGGVKVLPTSQGWWESPPIKCSGSCVAQS